MEDLQFRLERLRAPVTDEELIRDLRRVADLAKTNLLSFRLYSQLGSHSSFDRSGPIWYVEQGPRSR